MVVCNLWSLGVLELDCDVERFHAFLMSMGPNVLDEAMEVWC
jgi:hypothetical protein